jgi:serine phosphatase RsbU (regulator of sigma subunit)
LLFAIALACMTAMISALAPLWQAVRTHPNEVLSEGVRASAGARSRKLSRSLVVAEIALAFTLLSVSGLLIGQLQRLSHTSPGFDPDHLLTFELSLTDAKRPLAAYQQSLLQAFNAIPGVRSAAVANQLPMAGCCLSSTIFPETRATGRDVVRTVSFMAVSKDYFSTMKVPLRKGRLLNDHDTNEKLIPVVIDQTAARRYWTGSDPLGAVGHIGQPDGSRFQVVGIVGDVRNEGLGVPSRPEVFMLSSLAPPNPMQFMVRSNLPDAVLIPSIRRALRAIDPSQPIFSVRSMQEVIANSLSFQRLDSIVVGFFALAALLMASLGVFGVTSYSVRQRRTEIGTRMALGATSRDLLQLIVGSGISMAVYGVVLGAAAVIFVTILITRYFNIHEISAVPYVCAAAAMASVAIAASFFPAWRATLFSPMVAIRDESDSLWTATRHGVQQALGLHAGAEDTSRSDAGLLTDFIDVSRRSGSFPEVLRNALATLCERIGAESALLLELGSDGRYACVSSVPEEVAADIAIPDDGFLLNRIRFYSGPLAFAPADLDTSLRWASEQRVQQIEEMNALRRIGLRLAAGVRTRNEILGLLLLGPPLGRATYSRGDKRLIAACAEQFALMTENARLTDRVVEQEKIRRDVSLAAEVQRRLLPQQSPEAAASSFDAFTLPVRGVGGDYYDFLAFGKHRIGIALADVAGKGIAAAIIMAVVHASLRIIATEENISLPQLAARMNSFLHRSTGSSSYATFFYAQLDEESLQLRYVNAGHNPPYLVRTLQSSTNVEELATGGMIIGMFPFATYEEAAVDLKRGDVLLAFTDGVTEALNRNEEEFGEQRLKTLLCEVAPLPVEQIKSRISQELHAWIGDAPQHDDITFVVMKIN